MPRECWVGETYVDLGVVLEALEGVAEELALGFGEEFWCRHGDGCGWMC